MRHVSLQDIDKQMEFQSVKADGADSDKQENLADEFSRMLDEIASRVISNFLQDRHAINQAFEAGNIGQELKERSVPEPRNQNSTPNRQQAAGSDNQENPQRANESGAKQEQVATSKAVTGQAAGEKSSATEKSNVETKPEAGSTQEVTNHPQRSSTTEVREGRIQDADLTQKLEQVIQRIYEPVQEVVATPVEAQPKVASTHDQQQRELLEQALREMMNGQGAKINEAVSSQPNDLASALASMVFRSQIASGAVNGMLTDSSLNSSQAGTHTHQAIRELGAASSTRGDQSAKADELLKKMEQPLRGRVASHTMERVEQALREAARSRDGKTISLRLDPPDLGKLRVDVSLREGVLHARLMADSTQVSQLLREKSFELQRMLRGLGLEVEQVSVSIRDSESGRSGFDGSGSSNAKSSEQGQEQAGPALGEKSASESSVNNFQSAVVEDHWVA